MGSPDPASPTQKASKELPPVQVKVLEDVKKQQPSTSAHAKGSIIERFVL